MTSRALNILADENIALVQEAFSSLGALRTAPGRSISRAMLQDVDILLVRSITQVDAALLEGTRCRFVGTATSGTDHIDQDWLQQQGIAFADAHGCNAESVVDYVLAALALLAARDGRDWLQGSVGIVGCGAVGSRLARRLSALGLELHIHDPFLPKSHPLARYFAPLDVVLQQDVVTLHTPLTTEGPWPTRHMLDADRLALLKPDAVLVNAARGAVVDGSALLARMRAALGLRTVLDAWENEPDIDASLLECVDIGTAHIAGYSRLGKLRGTLQLRTALFEWLGLPQPEALAIPPGANLSPPLQSGSPLWESLGTCLLAAYDLQQDHLALQALRDLPQAGRGRGFDDLRKHYRERLEFSQLAVDAGAVDAELARALGAAGFTLR
jgi:erythronate-4-phosphate dehydrogenase